MKLKEASPQKFSYYQDRCHVCNSKIIGSKDFSSCSKTKTHLYFTAPMVTVTRGKLKLLFCVDAVYYIKFIEDESYSYNTMHNKNGREVSELFKKDDFELPIDFNKYFDMLENLILLS